MRKVTKKIIIAIIAVLMMAPLMTVQSSAASSVYISGGDNVKGGDTFYVAVTFDGGNIGRVNAGLNYDTDKLAYISGGSSDGNSGYVHLKLAGTGEAITFNLKFQAIADGQTSLNVETYEMYDLDERYMSDRPYASKTITITGNAADDQIIPQETSPDSPEEKTELIGVDEIQEDEDGVNITLILIIGAVLLVLIIVIISIVLAKKKSKKKTNKQANKKANKKYGKAPVSRAKQSSRPSSRQNDYSKTARRRASEETEVFSDWQINDDYNDIEKW